MISEELDKLNTDNQLLQELIIQVEKDFNMAGVDLDFKINDFTIQQFITHISKRLETLQKENYQKFSNLFYRIDFPLPTNKKHAVQSSNYYIQMAQKLIKHEFLKVWTRKNKVY